MTNLIPCPFCLSTPHLSEPDLNSFHIACWLCGNETSYYPRPSQAIDEWNNLCDKFKGQKLEPNAFLQTLARWNIQIHFNDQLHVFLFSGGSKAMRDEARNFIALNPELERYLLALKNRSFSGLSRDNLNLRVDYLYKLSALWEVHDNSLNDLELYAKSFWLKIIHWLSCNGGDIPHLPGAIRFFFTNPQAKNLNLR